MSDVPHSADGPSTQGDDPNLAAIDAAQVDDAHKRWMHDVAGMVDGRLDAVRPDWRSLPAQQALRATAFGLLLGLLAGRYPQSREVLSRVAEAHPSYGTFGSGGRLATLEQIAASGDLVAEWVGPILGQHDPAGLRPLYDFGSAPAGDQGTDGGGGAYRA